MQFRTEVDIAKADFEIQPAERMLFVGSCFADRLGHRFVENRFRATVNPFGVMYNPASILHTVEKSLQVSPRVAVFRRVFNRLSSIRVGLTFSLVIFYLLSFTLLEGNLF